MSTLELNDKLQRYLSYLDQDSNNISLLLNISNCYRLLRNWDSSQRYLDDAKQVAGQSFWTEQGIVYLDSGQLLFAKDAFMQALVALDTPTQRLNLGFCLYLNEEYDSALDVLTYPGDDKPVYDSHFLKAKILHHLQRPDDAIELLNQLLNHNLADSDVFGLLGLLHFDNNKIELAQLFSSRALDLNPLDSVGSIVRVLIKTLRNEVTVTELEAALIANPNECRLWFALGATHMQQMNITEAEQSFSRAIQIWPNFYDCWISSGWCHVLQNNLDNAESAYNQAVTLNAQSPNGWGGLALVHALRNNRKEAKTLLEKTLILDPTCFLALVTQIILSNQVNPTQAAKLLSDALPEVAIEMNQILNQAIMTANEKTPVIH